MQTPDERMTSITITELQDWSEESIDEEMGEIESLKFKEYRHVMYLEKLSKAKQHIQEIRDRIFDTFNNPNT